MDRLVSVDLKELEIEFRPSSRCSSVTFAVTNLMHTMSVAVHISTTRPSIFSLLPSQHSPFAIRLLPPLSSASFSLSLLPSPKPPPLSSGDALLVRSALIPTGRADPKSLLRLFSRPGVPLFRDASLPVSLTGPHVLHSFLSSPPEIIQGSALVTKAARSCNPDDLADLLRRAAVAGRDRIVSALIAAGADVDAADSDGRSPIKLAVISSSADSVKALLAGGAKLRRGLIHDAAGFGNAEIVVILAGSAPGWADQVDSSGRTPLHAAAAGRHLNAARVCISDGGADPDRADNAGWTPLHCAAAAGSSADLVEYLQSSSAFDARRAVTKSGRKTAFDLAVAGGHEHLYGLLRLDEEELLRAASKGEVSEIRSRGGADVDRRDQNGWTALHRAAWKGRMEAARALVEAGAAVDAVADAGWTPLRCAVEGGHADVALWLLGRGAGRGGLKGVKSARGLLGKLDLGCNKMGDFGKISRFCEEIRDPIGV